MKKFLLTLLTVLIGTSMMSAEEVTFSSFTATLSDSSGPVSYKAEKGQGQTNPRNDNTYFRLYAKNTLTISVDEGYTIDKIQFATESSNSSFLSGASASVGTFSTSNKSWTSPSTADEAITSVVLTNGTVNSGHTRINKITVTYSVLGSAEKTPVTLSWSPNVDTIPLGTAFISPVLTVDPIDALESVVYETSNPDLLSIDENGQMTLISNVTGSVVITASIPSDDQNYYGIAADYTLNVIDPNDISTEISVDDFGNTTSYTAYTYTDDYGVKYSTVYYYSGGVMQYNTSNNNGKGSGLNITANNSDYIVRSIDIDFASGGKGVYIYSSSTPFDALAKTTTPNYSSYTKVNTTPITSSTSNIGINAKAFAIVPSASGSIQINKITVHYELEATDTREEATLTFTPAQESYTITYGDTFTEPTLTVDPAEAASEVEYSSSNTEVATVDPTSGEITLVGAAGNATITAAIKDSETYKDVEVSYTLNVSVNVSSLTDFLVAKPETTTVISEPVTVYYQSPDKKYMFITDGTTNMMVYGTLSNTYQNGDVLTGIAGTYTEYGGMDELIPDASTFGEATEGTPIEPKAVTLAEEIAPCDFVILTGVDITEVNGNNATITDGTNSIDAYDRFGLSLAATENATIVAIGAVYNSTKQIYIVSVTETPDTREEVTLTFSETECSAVFGDAFIEPTLAVNPDTAAEEVKYSSSNTEVATVDGEGKVTILAAGNTTITAAIKDSETYKDVDASYTLTVIELGAIMFKDFVLDEGHMCGAFVGTPVTISAANAEAMSYTIDGGDLVEVEGSSFTWTPEAVGNYAFSVSASLAGQSKTVNFTVTVEEQTIEATLISDVLTLSCFGVSGTTYKEATYVSEECGLTYTAQMAGGNSSIQLRSNNSNSGIVVSANKYGLVAQAAAIKWNSNTSSDRALSFYGQQTAFTAPTELYNTEAESLGEKNIDDGAEQTIVFTEDFRYIGLRSKSGAQYVDSIAIIWTLPEPTVYIGEQNAPTIISQLPATLEFATTADEFVKVYYKFEEDGIAAAEAADGYTEVPAEGLTINSFGVLSYYAEVNGWTSNLSTIKFADTTGIVEIEGSEAGEAQWYDLNGRRVAAPGKGIYILKQGNKATKYAF